MTISVTASGSNNGSISLAVWSMASMIEGFSFTGSWSVTVSLVTAAGAAVEPSADGS